MTSEPSEKQKPSHRFSRRERIHGRRGFARVFAAKCSAGSRSLVIYACANGVGHARLGLSVGRRVGGAVVRARVRRRLREAFRMNKCALAPGMDYVCVARPGAACDDTLAEQLVDLAARAVKKARH